MRRRKALIYPKEWPQGLLYLKSPTSNVVHLCMEAIDETAVPMCGVWCWNSVIPTLPEDLNTNGLRFCKNCVGYLDDEFWHDKLAVRTDFVHLQHCSRNL